MSEQRERVSARHRSEQKDSNFYQYLMLPEGVKQFEVKADGVYRLRFSSYRVTNGNPYAKPGSLYYERTFYTHRNVGPNQDVYLCPAKNANQPCAICTYGNKAYREAGLIRNQDEAKIAKTAAKAWYAKQRQLWWVLDLDNIRDGWQVWDYSSFLFGDILNERIKNSDPEDDGYEYFADPYDGMDLKVAFKEENGGGYKFYETTSIDFKKWPKPMDMANVNAMPSLDDMLKLELSETIRSLFLQDDAHEEEPPARGRRGPPPPIDDDDAPAPAPRGRREAPPAEDDAPAPRGRRQEAPAEDDAPAPGRKTPPPEDDDVPAPTRGKRQEAPADDAVPAPKTSTGPASGKAGAAPTSGDDDWDDWDKKKK